MTIAQVSKKYDITVDTLRYYERINLIPTVHRNANGIRDYNEQDCGWVEFIKCMRNAGMTIEVLVQYVSLFQQGDTTVASRKKLLVEQRKQLQEKLEEIKQTIQRLDSKIEKYDWITQKEEQLTNPQKEEIKKCQKN